jgi:ribosome maturation factor RimP
MPDGAIIGRVQEIAGRVTASEGLELVEVELRGAGNNQVLRLFIDKPGGVTLADCENVSHQVGTILDVEDVIAGHYTLEVSSPGLDRKLLKPADYERFRGRKARIKLRHPKEGRSNFVGRLVELDQGQVSLEVEGGAKVRLPLEEVVTARLVVEF